MCGCNDAALMSQAALAMRPIPQPAASTPMPHATKNRLRPGTASTQQSPHDGAALGTGSSLGDARADLDDPIGEIDRSGSVRNHQHETADTELAYRSKNALLCRRVECAVGSSSKRRLAPRLDE